MFLFLALARSHTPLTAQWGSSAIFWKERLQLTRTKSRRRACSETTFPLCNLSTENIELIRSGLTDTNYFCCRHTRAKAGMAQNKDSALYWLKGAGGSANPADLLWQVQLTNFDWTQRVRARPILPKKIHKKQQQFAEFYVSVFLKDLALGDMRLNKNQRFNLKEVSSLYGCREKLPRALKPSCFSISPSYQ